MKNCAWLNNLPEEVRRDVMETLKAWEECYVEKYNDGSYKVSVGIGLTAWKCDYKVIASFNNYDIYTPEEIQKYANEVWSGCNMSDW